MYGTELASATLRFNMIRTFDIADHHSHYDGHHNPGCCLSPTDDSIRKNSRRYGAPGPKLRVAHLEKKTDYVWKSTGVMLQVVQTIVGYTARSWAVVVYRTLVLLSGGLLWLLSQYSPRARLWSLRKCCLQQADVVHVKVWCSSQQHCLLLS